MKSSVTLAVLLLTIISANAGWLPFWENEDALAEVDDQVDWWESGVFYQIYPRSFSDGNNDGTGDIKGIIARLEHLKELGVTGTWLSPIFKSPMIDGGYDIQDYRDVNPIYGTKQDLVDLFRRAKELGLKVILDFVPNHSSDQHEWFNKSAARDPEYIDYYTWRPCPFNNNTGKRDLPNNWIAVFNTPMWTYHEGRGECYHHQFTKEQPDMNYRMAEKKIQQEMYDILTYWLEQGADGFRVDAINHLFESASFTNQQLLSPELNPNFYESYDNIYTRDLNESYEFIYDVRAHLDNYTKNKDNITRILMTEAYATLEQQTKWYGTDSRPGSHVPFNFIFIGDITKDSNATLYKQRIDSWMANTPAHANQQANWVLGNHDRSRIRSRFGENRYEGMAVMSMTLPGVAVVYYGEEIGMQDNYNITWGQTDDPQACQQNPDNYMKYSRDPVRTPMQWDDSPMTGFCSSCNSTWLPIHENAKTLNVKAQKDDPNSTLSLYKALIQLRKDNVVLRKGGLSTKVLGNDDVFAYERTINDHPTVAVFINMGPQKRVSLADLLSEDDFTTKTKARVLISTNGATLKKDAQVEDLTSIPLGAYDAVVLEISSATRLAQSAMFAITIFWIIVKIFS